MLRRHCRCVCHTLMFLGITALAARPARADDKADARAAWHEGYDQEQKGNYPVALAADLKALALAEKAFGPDDKDTAAILNNLAILYAAMGQYAKAEPLYLRSLKIRENKLGKDHPDVAKTVNNLAILYVAMGQHAKAEPLYLRSLKIYEDKLGKDHPDVGLALNNLAELYRNMGQYAKAEPLYLRSLKIREDKLGQDHPLVADTVNNLALLYVATGQYAKAEPLYLRSLKINEDKLGQDHPDVAGKLNNLALLYVAMGQCAKAEPLYLRSLKIYEDKLGRDHPLVAATLNNLANFYRNMGQYAKAEPLFLRSLKIREDKLGKDHPDVSNSVEGLAILYVAMGQYAKAEPLYLRSLKIREDKLGQDHPDVARYGLHNLAVLYGKTGNWSGALQSLDRARRIIRRHVASVLPLLSPREQLTFLDNTDRHQFSFALSTGFAGRSHLGLIEASATWLVNGKAVAQETLAHRALLARENDDPALADKVGELLATRRKLAALLLSPPKTGEEADRKRQLAELTSQEEQLAKQLAAAGSQAVAPNWIDLATLRRAVPANAILVNIARFNLWNVTKEKDAEGKVKPPLGDHYMAWLVPPADKGDVQLVDLGDAAPIEALVKTALDGVRAAPAALNQQGEVNAEKSLRESLNVLSAKILQPIIEHTGDADELILSPDGPLWLVPWAALPLSDGQYAIEKYKLRYAVSGRELVADNGPSKKPSAGARIFANPDYNLTPKDALASLDAFKRGFAPSSPSGAKKPDLNQLADNDRHARSATTIGRVSLLPGTAKEAQLISPNLQKLAGGGELKTYQDKQALEGVFKRLRSPKVLVLSTHGYFLPAQQVKSDERNPLARQDDKQVAAAVDKEGNPLENPLLRCGLLLAGCNLRDKITDATLDDGVLTGMEIVGTDLRGTDLVVLSACETGLGDVQNGEGVAGLRQAFQLAGAKSVVSTLWQIPDRETAQLMNDFFVNLAAGQGKADGLRNAQLAMIKTRREKEGAAHPLYWAAFTLTGQ